MHRPFVAAQFFRITGIPNRTFGRDAGDTCLCRCSFFRITGVPIRTFGRDAGDTCLCRCSFFCITGVPNRTFGRDAGDTCGKFKWLATPIHNLELTLPAHLFIPFLSPASRTARSIETPVILTVRAASHPIHIHHRPHLVPILLVSSASRTARLVKTPLVLTVSNIKLSYLESFTLSHIML